MVNKVNNKINKDVILNTEEIIKSLKGYLQPTTPTGDPIEPREYFEQIKGKLSTVQAEELDKALLYYAEQIKLAEGNGQESLLSSLRFGANTILKEIELLSIGIDTYILRDDLDKTVQLIEPKGSVKVIELERFPRIIPPEPSAEIARVRELGIFDKFCVVFTDFTGKDYATPEEKKIIERNKDPIVFGYFQNNEVSYIDLSTRFYFITDWEDEFCDLTLDKLSKIMIDKQVTTNPTFTVEDAKGIIQAHLLNNRKKEEIEEPSSFFKRLKNFFK